MPRRCNLEGIILTLTRPDVPDWVKNDTESQKNTWEIIAKELEAIHPGCVSRLL